MTTLAKDVAKLIDERLKVFESERARLKSKVNLLIRQRDAARGKAAEYRSYAAKYQRELAEARKNAPR